MYQKKKEKDSLPLLYKLQIHLDYEQYIFIQFLLYPQDWHLNSKVNEREQKQAVKYTDRIHSHAYFPKFDLLSCCDLQLDKAHERLSTQQWAYAFQTCVKISMNFYVDCVSMGLWSDTTNKSKKQMW